MKKPKIIFTKTNDGRDVYIAVYPSDSRIKVKLNDRH